MYKTWKGRIQKDTDKAVESFTDSLSVDSFLYRFDIMGNLAYIKCLKKAGILTAKEADLLVDALKNILEDIDNNEIEFKDHEDIHSLVEGLLIEATGDVAKKIHTGRSRNDQVVLDMRMAVKEFAYEFLNSLLSLAKNIASTAGNFLGLVMPSYTHLQKGQPVLVSHYFMAYANKFKRDIDFMASVFENADSMPLGSGASVGSSYGIDRKLLADILKFKNIDSNSMDAVSSRDFLLDFIYALSKSMIHLSRLSEDLIIYVSQEFSYFDIDDAFCTGSSIMPQKKNPDVLELVRGKSSLVIGNLNQVMVLVKGLPMTYNRDLQEDKKIFLSAYEESISSVNVLSELIKNMKANRDKLEISLNKSYIEATDIADYLVGKGESFRDAHNIVGRIVRYCIDSDLDFKELKLDVLKKYSDKFEEDFFEAIKMENCINSKKTDCSTNPSEVRIKISDFMEVLEKTKTKISKLKKRLPTIEELLL